MDKEFIKTIALAVCFTATLILLGNFYTYLLSSTYAKITFNEIYPFTITSLFTGGVLGSFFINLSKNTRDFSHEMNLTIKKLVSI